jgi:hypothetical protein
MGRVAGGLNHRLCHGQAGGGVDITVGEGAPDVDVDVACLSDGGRPGGVVGLPPGHVEDPVGEVELVAGEAVAWVRQVVGGNQRRVAYRPGLGNHREKD